MKNVSLLLVFVAALLTGCAYQLTTYQYDYPSNELPVRDFYYTDYNLRGSATVSIEIKLGSTLNGLEQLDGLIASAKQDLMLAHPLGPNESYVNWSVDQVSTESGTVSNGARFVRKVEHKVVVSADVIRFGLPPEGYERPVIQESAAQPPSSNSAVPNRNGFNSDANTTGAMQSSQGFQFAVGDSVIVSFRNNRIQGEVKDRLKAGTRSYLVEFSYNNKKKLNWFYENKIEPTNNATPDDHNRIQ